MNKPRLILLGAGGHASACIDVIEQHGQFEIAGLVGLGEEVRSERLGYSVVATDHELPDLSKLFRYSLVTVGQIRDPESRIRLYRMAMELGFQLPVIISPFAYVSPHAVIGAGTIVMHGAIVNAGAKVGVNCIINSRALVEHDVMIEDHCHIATGAVLNGNASVGKGTFVGSGSKVKEGIKIGKGCIVGMGVAVKRHQPDETMVIGEFKS